MRSDSVRREGTTLRASRVRTIVLAAAATAAFLWIMGDAGEAARSAAAERAPALAPADATAGWPAPEAAPAQGGDEEANPDGDQRVPVQLWTLVAAGGAAGVGLLAFLLRLAMGWVKPPPAREESHH